MLAQLAQAARSAQAMGLAEGIELGSATSQGLSAHFEGGEGRCIRGHFQHRVRRQREAVSSASKHNCAALALHFVVQAGGTIRANSVVNRLSSLCHTVVLGTVGSEIHLASFPFELLFVAPPLLGAALRHRANVHASGCSRRDVTKRPFAVGNEHRSGRPTRSAIDKDPRLGT